MGLRVRGWLPAVAALSMLLAGCGQQPAPHSQAAADPAPAHARGGGGLPDGVYDCGDGEHVLGKVDIQGATFRYRPLDATGGVFSPYSVNTSGQIHWGGAFPGIDDPPARVTTSTRIATGFKVNFKAAPAGDEATVNCIGPAV